MEEIQLEDAVNYDVEFDYSEPIGEEGASEEAEELGEDFAEDASYSMTQCVTIKNSEGFVADVSRIKTALEKLGYANVMLTKVEVTGNTVLL